MERRNRSGSAENIPAASPHWAVALAALVIALAAVAAYQNSFSGTFVLDDLNWIETNPNIRQLSTDLAGAVSRKRPVGRRPARGQPYAGRSITPWAA